MFSFLMGIVTIIQKGKSRLSEKTKIYNEKRKELYEKAGIKSSVKNNELNGVSNKTTDNKTIKSNIMTFLTSIVVFFETLPLFFSLIIWSVILLCVVALVVVIFALMAMLKSLLEEDEQFDSSKVEETTTASDQACLNPNSLVPWTDEDLASRGAKLTDYEKNVYRLGVLSRKTVTGYYGKKYLQVNEDDYTSTLMLMGILSTESSMVFHSDGKNRSIYETPSNQPLNSAGYGFLGLSNSETLGKLPSDVTTKVKSEYKPTSSYSYEAQYVPYGTLLAANHLNGKLSTALNGIKKQNDVVSRVLDEWGIKANKKEAEAVITHMLAQAQYHGAVYAEYEAYANFWASMFHASSEKDEERSFSRWSLKIDANNNYSESVFRKAVLGTDTYGRIGGYASPSSLKTANVATVIQLNGKPIGKPLWAFLGDKYMSNKGFLMAWNQVKSFSNIAGAKGKESGGGVGARVLNFHYGLNSYLQSKRLEQVIATKMGTTGTVSDSSNCGEVTTDGFKVTKGKSQAVLNGKTTEQLVTEWYAKNSGNKASHMKLLQAQWGTSSYLSDENTPSRKEGYIDKKFGVPFYGQNRRFGETYGTLPWYSGAETFNYSGCMVYSHAYAASAMTGKLINPAEMGSILIMRGYMSNAGIARTGVESIYKDMGLQSETYSNTLASWDKIKDVLRKNGVVVVRAKAGYFTKSYNHFITLTGIQEKDGKTLYSFYTSYEPDKSMTMIEESKLKSNLHLQAVAVWK